MSAIKDIYDKLYEAQRPIEIFGKVEKMEDFHSLYAKAKKDIEAIEVSGDDRYYADEALQMLDNLYVKAMDLFDIGMYDKESDNEEPRRKAPIFQVSFDNKMYLFFKLVCAGEVATIYEGTCGDESVCIKVSNNIDDNELIALEYDVLSWLHHISLPCVIDSFVLKDKRCFTMRKIEGVRAEEVMRNHPNGVPAEHVLWMIERLLGVVGFLHTHNVVHGNIKPDNIVIDKTNHNVTLTGFAFAIPNANEKSARYRFKNKHYTADEVGNDTRVEPSTDIYSIGKVAIYLLGGNVADSTMPEEVPVKVKEFVLRMVKKAPSSRPYDAWKLHKELQALRTELFGPARYKKFE